MLEIKNLSYSYGRRGRGRRVLSGLHLHFPPGFNVLLGPNGAGKTTLMKAIFGLLPARGEILLWGKNMATTSIEERTALMSYLPQMDIMTSNLTVLEITLLGRLPELGYRVKEEDLKLALEALHTLGIPELASRPFSQLSGGQQKLVLIAQTLVREPQLILLDEPVNSLDMQKQLELCQILSRIVADGRVSVLAILHDINLAARFARHMAILDGQGRLYSAGSPREVITEKMLREVYGVRAQVTEAPDGVPMAVAQASIHSQKTAP
ncbi:MAG: ABC transporter ATP-binding protein [Tissierellia bacterium]|nr:ABC transporter ATP-binding protein [Tissierellia bacterium]